MDLNGRRDRIFDIIVRAYIETADPVGSRTISKNTDLNLSPASIRNVMADLEEAGLLMQPHTSSGRIPTDKGYRYWVDRLMEHETLAGKEREWVQSELAKAKSAAGLADRASKVISELTESAALVYIKNLKRISFLNQMLEEMLEAQGMMECLEEAELFIEGASRVLDQPEFQDIRKMKHLIQAFDEQNMLIQLLLGDLQGRTAGAQMHIGREIAILDLEDISIVSQDCLVACVPIATFAVVGPTRMNYQKAVAVVEYVAGATGEELKRF